MNAPATHPPAHDEVSCRCVSSGTNSSSDWKKERRHRRQSWPPRNPSWHSESTLQISNVHESEVDLSPFSTRVSHRWKACRSRLFGVRNVFLPRPQTKFHDKFALGIADMKAVRNSNRVKLFESLPAAGGLPLARPWFWERRRISTVEEARPDVAAWWRSHRFEWWS